MTRTLKNIIIFLIAFVISFFIVGYVRNTFFIAIDWVEQATVWDKMAEYYIRTFTSNLIPAFILGFLSTVVISAATKKKKF